jgi:succinate dehydrogenase hydrophobic anchor subunit
MLYENMIWGSNKYGQKKLYKLDRFLQPRRTMFFTALLLISYNLVYLGLALYYKKLEHDIWMNSYGDYFPKYEKAGVFTVRTFCKN